MRQRAARARSFVVVAMALFLIVSLPLVVWLRSDAVDPYREALFAREPVTLAPGVHMLGRLFPSVAYVVETSDGLVLIDSGLEADALSLREQLAALQLDPSRIKAILLTHAHGDHTLGARYLRETTGAKIHAGRGDSDVLRAGGPREAFFSTFPMDAYSIHATPVDVELTGGEVLKWGDTQIEVLATPGHTPGSTCYLLRRDGLRILFTGDTISSLRLDIGTYAVHLAPRYRGDAPVYLKTLQRLRAMPAPDLVLPGHPMADGVPHSPRLIEAEWRSLLDRGIRDVNLVLSRHERDGADFLDGVPKELLPGLHYLGHYAERAVYTLVTPQGHFLFDAPGDHGFFDFWRERLRQAGIDGPPLVAVVLTSCDPQAIAGLAAVAAQTQCQVVAPDACRELVASNCPEGTTILSPDRLPEADWFAVQVLPLAGLASGPTAYILLWEGKRVLVSGDLPVKFSEQTAARLQDLMKSSSADPTALLRSLEELRGVRPDLWLPSRPVHAQNANLYGDEWWKVLEQTAKVVAPLSQ